MLVDQWVNLIGWWFGWLSLYRRFRIIVLDFKNISMWFGFNIQFSNSALLWKTYVDYMLVYLIAIRTLIFWLMCRVSSDEHLCSNITTPLTGTNWETWLNPNDCRPDNCGLSKTQLIERYRYFILFTVACRLWLNRTQMYLTTLQIAFTGRQFEKDIVRNVTVMSSNCLVTTLCSL